ncbi:MAG: hypothetical protein ABI721_02475 [Candidatus Dojkabacteria bacterium]
MDKSPETATVKETTEVSKSEVTPTSEVKTESKTTTETSEKKSGKNWLLICGCGCLLLLVCCVAVSAGLFFFAPQVLTQVLPTVFKNGSQTVTPTKNISSDPAVIKQESAKAQAKLDDVQAQLDSLPPGSKVVLNLAPDELVYLIASNSGQDISNYLPYISVGMEDNLLTAQIDVGGLINTAKQDPTSQIPTNTPIDLSLLQGVVAKVEVVTSPDGKTVAIKSFTTGNPFLDGFVNVPSVLDSANQEINSSLNDYTDGVKIDSIKITQNNMALTLQN